MLLLECDILISEEHHASLQLSVKLSRWGLLDGSIEVPRLQAVPAHPFARLSTCSTGLLSILYRYKV